jgi:hypothetical protein
LHTWFDSNSSSTLFKLKDRAIYFEANWVIEESLGTPLMTAAISPFVPPNISIPPVVPVSFGLYALSYPSPLYWYPSYSMTIPLVTQEVIAVDTNEGFKGSCYRCGKPGHRVAQCYSKSPGNGKGKRGYHWWAL